MENRLSRRPDKRLPSQGSSLDISSRPGPDRTIDEALMLTQEISYGPHPNHNGCSSLLSSWSLTCLPSPDLRKLKRYDSVSPLSAFERGWHLLVQPERACYILCEPVNHYVCKGLVIARVGRGRGPAEDFLANIDNSCDRRCGQSATQRVGRSLVTQKKKT